MLPRNTSFSRRIENSHRNRAWWEPLIDGTPPKRGESWPFYITSDRLVTNNDEFVLSNGWIDIITIGGTSAPINLLPDTIELQGASASDTAGGIGARTVRVIGITAGPNFLVETIALNGVNPVTTVNEFLSVIMMQVATAGSTGWNVGLITALDSGYLNQFADINAEEGQTNSPIMYAPNGYEIYIDNIEISNLVDGIVGILNKYGPGVEKEKVVVVGGSGIGTTQRVQVSRWFPSGSLLYVTANNDSGANRMVGCRMNGILRYIGI